MAILFIVNAGGVRSFGETEYWLSATKVVAVIVFIIVGLIVDVGGFGEPAIGFEYYTIPGAPFKNGVIGVFNVFLFAFFSFGGTELVGITAGETKNPRKTVPKAIYGTFWRILLFYILSIFVMGLVIRNDDPHLLDSADRNDVTVAPFTMVLSRVPAIRIPFLSNTSFTLFSNDDTGNNTGIPLAAHIMNGVILSAVLSAGNSAMYAASRTLMALAQEGRAPQVFAQVNARGVPFNALCVTTAVGCLAFLGTIWGTIIHIRFRAALKAQGRAIKDLPYVAPWFPVGDVVSVLLGIGIVFGEGYAAAKSVPFQLQNVVAVYLGLPLFFGLYIFYKIRHKTRMVDPAEADLDYYRSHLAGGLSARGGGYGAVPSVDEGAGSGSGSRGH
ncbi:hypothetical protein HK102_013513 [Quaeritorhiza haematococci]|nr:hypothetical protein HK102_013513 [Quaeritorhiza haematococci]